MTTKNNARPSLSLKFNDPDTYAQLHALAARDGLSMNRWIHVTIRREFRKLPQKEQNKWLAPIEEGDPR